MSAPKLIERQCGGWLAISPACEPIKIGVSAETEQDAAFRYRVALAQWRMLLAPRTDLGREVARCIEEKP